MSQLHQPLAPFPELVNERFDTWLSQQQGTRNQEPGNPRITESQLVWLKVIRDYIALNGAFATDDPEAYLDAWQSVDSRQSNPFAVARKAFGNDPKEIIEELNQILVA